MKDNKVNGRGNNQEERKQQQKVADMDPRPPQSPSAKPKG